MMRFILLLFLPVLAYSQCAQIWEQCNGISWTGPKCCQSDLICSFQNEWYSQCIPSPTSSIPTPSTSVPMPSTSVPTPSTSVPTSSTLIPTSNIPTQLYRCENCKKSNNVWNCTVCNLDRPIPTTVPPTTVPPTAPSGIKNKKIVFGYFPEWGIYGYNYKISDVDGSKITHLLYAFQVPNPSIKDFNILKQNNRYPINVYDPLKPEGTLTAHDTYAWNDVNLPALRIFKSKYPNTKIILSVGGWTLSWHLTNIFKNPVARATFVKSTLKVILDNGFHGIDIDWEFPGFKGHSYNMFDPVNDKNYFTAICREFREEFDRIGRPDLEIAFAMSADHAKMPNYLGCVPYVNYVGIMTYDFNGAWSQDTGHHSAFNHFPGNVDNKFYVQGAIDSALSLGFPRDKLLIGAPFYGRGWSQCTTKTNNQIFTKCLSPAPNYDTMGGGESGLLNWRFLKNRVRLPGYTEYWDDVSHASYAYNPSLRELWTYDNPRAIKLKVDQVIAQKLGGVIVWDLSADNGELLNIIHTTFMDE